MVGMFLRKTGDPYRKDDSYEVVRRRCGIRIGTPNIVYKELAMGR